MVTYMLRILSAVLIGIILFVGVLLAYSSGKPEPFLDENGKVLPGSISEKIWVSIGGIQQGMFIKGKNSKNPVLLFLHGGPGLPEYAISRKYPTVLEDLFTVCWWEQRGAGLSYNPSIPLETMTFEQLKSDTKEVTAYLRKRFGQDKIYLMGHSAGSFIGVQVVAESPEFYHAYLAMAQITNQLESEKLAYLYMTAQFTKQKDTRMQKRFAKYPITQINTPSYYVMRDAPMHKLGIGTTHQMKSVMNGVFWPIMFHKEYTLPEKINIWRGKAFCTNTAKLWSQLVDTDITKKIEKLTIPVYFFEGVYDYTVSYTLAKAYFEKLDSPLKAFYIFDQSAHSPLFEEPELMRQILENDVLRE
jgi:pimeloyl-ACP methyl ester carboxylesterase